jgi:hypothetical protein
LRKDFLSRRYAVRLIVKMTELFAGNKVSWSNRGECTGKDSVEVRADFKYVEIIVRTRQAKLDMPNPEIEITHRLHPKARFTFLPTEDTCEHSRCVLLKPTRTVNHPDAAWPSHILELLLYSDQVLPRRLSQILRVEALNDDTRNLVKAHRSCRLTYLEHVVRNITRQRIRKGPNCHDHFQKGSYTSLPNRIGIQPFAKTLGLLHDLLEQAVKNNSRHAKTPFESFFGRTRAVLIAAVRANLVERPKVLEQEPTMCLGEGAIHIRSFPFP